MSERRILTFDDWQKEAKAQTGGSTQTLVFKCVQCGGLQCAVDFERLDNLRDDPRAVVSYSCIGRWDRHRGCDWTLGGLLHIHKVEVDFGDGSENLPSFELASSEEAATHLATLGVDIYGDPLDG